MAKKTVICSYYFPNWHVDPRNEKLHGKGWTEWRTTQYATPRFPGHNQPLVPLWGYEDEADPVVMRKKIDAAQQHGIAAFVFDYYWFQDGSYRERCIAEGFLPACKGTDFKFSVMWANHDPIYSHPGSYLKPAEPLWTGEVDPATFTACTEHLIEKFFCHPNYLKIDGKIYFSIFNLKYMLKTNGVETLRAMFDDLRRRVRRAGLGELWLDVIHAHMRDDTLPERPELIAKLGIDSCSSYALEYLPDTFPSAEYADADAPNMEKVKAITAALPVPYNPAATAGWDSSPRTVQSDMYEQRGYPFTVVLVNNTPEAWEKHLQGFRDFLDSGKSTAKILHLACWNEWTEGMFLEPDAQYGFARLEAVKKIFGKDK